MLPITPIRRPTSLRWPFRTSWSLGAHYCLGQACELNSSFRQSNVSHGAICSTLFLMPSLPWDVPTSANVATAACFFSFRQRDLVKVNISDSCDFRAGKYSRSTESRKRRLYNADDDGGAAEVW